jgi:biotin carboxyl carrier protein
VIVRLQVDGRSALVELSDDRTTVTIDGQAYPVRIIDPDAARIELEIAGEKVTVEAWPRGLLDPPDPIAVNGERVEFSIEARSGPAIAESQLGTAPARTMGGAPAGPVPVARPVSPSSNEMPIAPPMPGKILEVRVGEGQRVGKGDILLVLEAMKMRNEIPSPVPGTVIKLAVQPGQNVRAREPMLYLVPDPS